MDMNQKIEEAKKYIVSLGVDGWLIYDFRRNNLIGCEFLEMPVEKPLTRRFFYWIPKEGEPVKIVQAIEPDCVKHLPGKLLTFRSWQELEMHVQNVLQGSKKIAMEYSPRNAVPYISFVDAGTMEVIRGFGVDVVSSGEILQKFTSVLTPQQIETHFEASQFVDQAVAKAWAYVREKILKDEPLTEYDVCAYIHSLYKEAGFKEEPVLIVGVGPNSANPHYYPKKNASAPIKKGDFLLIDIWAKKAIPKSVYCDICRVGVVDVKPSLKQQEIFNLVKSARDLAFNLLEERIQKGQSVMACELDAIARKKIEEAGYGEYFTHRLGHNIGERDHGDGAHLDSFETQDLRRILPGTCFSIEPGIYLPGEFGVRLEYDVLWEHDGTLHRTGGVQEEIECVLG